MAKANSLLKPLAFSAGEPAGIGPDLVIQHAQLPHQDPLLVIADGDLLTQRAKLLGLPLKIRQWQGEPLQQRAASEISLLHVPLKTPVTAGCLDKANAPYVLSCLDLAIDGCLDGRFAGLVTGPLHKGIVNDAGIAFSGHTEYLQERCEVDKVVMMLASSRMRVALATTHLPLAEVPAAITFQSLSDVLRILISDLQHKFGIARPRILVSGLNPHAGEGGHMGREEIDIIEPVLAHFKDANATLVGPLPADTLFTPKYLEQADAVLAMYHDQGLPVLKYDGFGESVNITLGLPIVRTSVDHGTALDLAATGKADIGSLKTAIRYATQMAYHSLT